MPGLGKSLLWVLLECFRRVCVFFVTRRRRIASVQAAAATPQRGPPQQPERPQAKVRASVGIFQGSQQKAATVSKKGNSRLVAKAGCWEIGFHHISSNIWMCIQ